MTSVKYKGRMILWSLAIVGLNACGGGGSDSAAGTGAQAIAQARALWSKAPSADYVFTLATQCFCLPESPITVVVRNGAVAEAYDADTLQQVPESRRQGLPTLPELLRKVEQAYATDAARVDVTFHPSQGYVQSLYIDQDRRMADEEIGYRVSNVVWNVNGVYHLTAVKSTGERQCVGAGVSIDTLQAELVAAGNQVVDAACGWDGMAYPAVCGAGTGKVGVFRLSGATPPRLPQGFFPLSDFPQAQVTSCTDAARAAS